MKDDSLKFMAVAMFIPCVPVLGFGFELKDAGLLGYAIVATVFISFLCGAAALLAYNWKAK